MNIFPLHSILFSSFIFFNLVLLPAQDSTVNGSRQCVQISNLGKGKGALMMAWFNSEEAFRKKDKAVYSRKQEVRGEDSVNIYFDEVPPGTYAIAVFLDENGNGKLDVNMFGIPKEKYGFSNNIYPAFRGANYKEASFQIQDQEQTIRIRFK